MTPLIVHLHGRRAGVLEDDGRRMIFRYDPAWLADAEALPLSRQLPLQSEPFEGQRVNVFFSGLLPEADARDQIARNLGISANNDFAMLERIGGECAGAITLLPGEQAGALPSNNDLRWLSEEEAAGIIKQLPQRPLLAGEQGLRLSLAGAQVKLPVVIEMSSSGAIRMALPLGDTPSTHIIKPEPLRFPGLAENEAWCMALARHLGLNAAEVWQERIGDVPCLIAKRYDRASPTSDAMVQRLHQEDFCQALGYPSSRKYQQEGGPSLRECFQLIRDWSTTPVLDIRHMLDAVIFAVMIGNADAHGKNHSFLYSGESRRMAPLYDQVCTMMWPELSSMLSMKVGTASRLEEVSPEHFKQLCDQAKLGWPMVRERIGELCRRTHEATRDPSALPELQNQIVRDVVTRRVERMLGLLDKARS
ncbi:MAG: Serine/threonine-protein kinase HipA [Verrucomicrobiota bacterium]|jgi:serine/threonine-protein kinase HipA